MRPVMVAGVAALLVVVILARDAREGGADWYDRTTRDVEGWVRVSISGAHKSSMRVRTTDGRYRVRPIDGLLHRAELVPRRGDVFSMVVAIGSERRVVSGRPPFSKRPFGEDIRVDVVHEYPDPVWDMSEMRELPLPRGGVLHSDHMASGKDVLVVPGKNSPFVDRTALLRFREQNIRIHVVYYEDHTFARTGSNIDCGFASGSIKNSLVDIRHALRVTGARSCIAYSMGGLLVTSMLREDPSFQLDALVLLHPFLSYSVKCASWFPTSSLLLGFMHLMGPTLPVVRGQRIIPRRRVRLDYMDYLTHKYPLSVPNPLERDDTRRYVRSTLSLAFVVTRAIAELEQEAPKLGTPVLLIGGTQDDVCNTKANMRVCHRIFSRVDVKTFSSTHNVFPSANFDEDSALVRVMSSYLSSQSRGVVSSNGG